VRGRVRFPHGWKCDDPRLAGYGLALALRHARMVGDVQVQVLPAGAGDFGHLACVDPRIPGGLRVLARGVDRAGRLLLRILTLALSGRAGAVHRVNERLRVVDAIFLPAPAARECEYQRHPPSPRS